MSAGREGDGAAEPLIRHESEESEGREDVDRHAHEPEEDEEDLVAFGWFIWILTFSAGVSGLLFGYEYVLLARCRCYIALCRRRAKRPVLTVLVSSPRPSSPSAQIYPRITRH